MKKLSIFLFLLSAVFVSCEEDLIVYDNVSGQSFIQFEASAVDLPVPLEGSETISIPISVSTISSTERRISVSVVQEGTTLSAANYSFGDAIIPANSYNGTLEVTGTNASLVIGEVETIVFKIDSLSTGDFNANPGTVTVSVFLSCDYDPLSFVGTYTANESGFATPYEVVVTYDANTELFRFDNLYRNSGGITYATFNYDNNVATIDFKQDRATNFGVLQVNATFGNVYAVNPSVASGNPGSNISTFRTCDNFIDLHFRRQIQDGRFFGGTPNITLTKKVEGEEGEEEEED